MSLVTRGLHDLFLRHVIGAEQLLQAAVGAVQQPQENVLHRDILVLHGLGGGLGGLQGFVHVLGNIDLSRLPAAAGHLGQLLHLGGHRGGEAGHRHAHGGQKLGNKALLVAQEGQEQVLLLDLLVAVLHGDILGPLNGGQRFLGELVHVHMQETSFALVSISQQSSTK